ncbi:MAG: TlpA family protein disulfide reductase [Gemmatimonadetes bacterium]|nr:TlpA family protein disulfide reductase [Gemmatimonadota bacterium]
MKPAIFTSLLSLLLIAGSGCSDPEVVEVGKTAPGFELESLDGTWVESDSFKGDVLILNFWATWCTPCLKEIPELKKIDAASDVQIVGIALDQDGRKAVSRFVERHGMEYTILLGNDDVFQRFQGFGIPYTLILDASFKVVKIYRGPFTAEALEQDLQDLAQGA